MINDYKVLGVIPARGGSKGLPDKNIKNLHDKPLLAWTIETAHASDYIDDVIVSTDDLKIKEIALEYGAEVPFIRPDNLASDTASSIDVVEHAINELANSGRAFDIVVMLEPTSPLREASDIDKALSQLNESDAGAIVSVCKSEATHPSFMYKLCPDTRLQPFMGLQPTNLRRQDIEPLFFLEGTLYISWINILKSKHSFYHEGTIAYEVPKWKSLEIDDADDFIMVEALAKHKGLIE
jgi:CMP-N,N'-diacetyllegionaminic acid synthase